MAKPSIAGQGSCERGVAGNAAALPRRTPRGLAFSWAVGMVVLNETTTIARWSLVGTTNRPVTSLDAGLAERRMATISS